MAATALLLIACTNEGSTVAIAGTATTAGGTTTAGRTTTPRPSTTGAPTSTPPATKPTTPTTATATTVPTTSAPATSTASGRCHSNELTLSLGNPDIAAGNVYVPIVLRNSSARSCAVAGYPGVSLLDAAGAMIGTPATREPGFPAHAVRLAPGQAASTAIHTANQGIAPGGCWPPSSRVRVFPPNELDALEVAGAVTVCGDLFSIRPLVSGTAGR
jgi:hypothetical protein